MSSARGNRRGLPVVVEKGRTQSVVSEADSLGDAELLERARQGEISAYEALVRRYQDVAFRTAFIIAGSAADAEDAAQEAFIKAYYALGRFRAGAPFRPWLLRIVASEAHNRRKSAARRSGPGLEAAEHLPLTDEREAPETSAMLKERRRALVAGINRLSAVDRLAIAYRYFFDLSEAEMAEALGWARGTVKSRLARALLRLRKILSETGREFLETTAEGGE